MDYSQYVQRDSSVPQSAPVPGKNMTRNNAGGFTFKVDKWQQLDRFLVLGSQGGTYYVDEKSLTLQNFAALDECLKEDPYRVVRRVVEISENGRAPKNDPALFVLAKAGASSKEARRFALDVLPKVARTGTHLFHFVQFATKFRGWGRVLKRGIANWYTSKPAGQLAYQAAKYKQRDGWSHRDLLRLSHPKALSTEQNALFCKIVHPELAAKLTDLPSLYFYEAAQEASVTDNAERAAQLIRQYNLPRECINTQLLNSVEVWEALLENMPMTALIRNLGKISSLGMASRYGGTANKIVQKLMDAEALKKARVHPITLLGALNVYKNGRGVLGSLTWDPNREIVEALNDAFYLAFDFIQSTGKRYLLGLDISGSMGGSPVNGITGLDARTASAAMALATLRTEEGAIIKGFSAKNQYSWWANRNNVKEALDGFIDLNVSRRMLLDQVIQNISGLPMGATDCALPMIWAKQNNVPVDVFVIYTDSETWHGDIHPFEALKHYRDALGIPAKLVVAGVSATDVSIADPTDPGMLDIVGFDSAAPSIISDFVMQKLD
jgi:60 kDa SS-A/Ro ribonucleoprotein